MKIAFRYILLCLAMTVILFSSCTKDENKVIPRSKMAQIYAEMMITDQWLQMEPDVRRMADTSLIYEPILQKYGYDSEMYRRSVYSYLDDPERFARILRETIDIFNKRLNELNRIKDIQDAAKEREKAREKFRPDFKAAEHFPYMHDEPYIHYYDSLAVELDSLTNEYRFRNIELSDTLYEGIEMVIKVDSTAICDSIARADSLARVDSLARADSIARLGKAKSQAPKTEEINDLNKNPISKRQIRQKEIRTIEEMKLIVEDKKTKDE